MNFQTKAWNIWSLKTTFTTNYVSEFKMRKIIWTFPALTAARLLPLATGAQPSPPAIRIGQAPTQLLVAVVQTSNGNHILSHRTAQSLTTSVPSAPVCLPQKPAPICAPPGGANGRLLDSSMPSPCSSMTSSASPRSVISSIFKYVSLALRGPSWARDPFRCSFLPISYTFFVKNLLGPVFTWLVAGPCVLQTAAVPYRILY